MNLTELRTFMAIHDTGSLVRASHRLHVTQSTVTARLKSLEDELGQQLINRQKSGATLTAAGVRLLRYAETISNLWQQARQETALPGAYDAVCNIATHQDLWPDLGARLFDWIRQNAPNVALSVWTGGAAEMAGWLADGLADLAFSYTPNATATQQLRHMGVDQIRLVSTNPDAPLRFDPDYVYVEAGEEFGRWHAAEYADAGTARLNFGTAQIGLDHILTSGGTAYLPMRLAQPFVRAGRLHEISDAPQFDRPIHLIANRSAITAWPWFETAVTAIGDVDASQSQQPQPPSI